MIMNILTQTEDVGQGFERQAAYFKALAHPVRLQILTILEQGEACVCHLEELLNRRQAYISQQLRVLKEAGLLTERRQGLFVFYRLADPHLAGILRQSRHFVRQQEGEPAGLFSLSPRAPSLANCACPDCASPS